MIAADGARSTLRRLMGLGFEGRVFQDQFLICDIKMKMERPAERWFWFDPPFNRGRSALLHKQADDVWRLDFQVGDEADRDEEMKPENVGPTRARACWARTSTSPSSGSASTASSRGACSASGTVACCLPAMPRTRCRRSARAAATAAYRTPTTSSGSSIWCCAGWRPRALLDSYDAERIQAADENLLNTTRSTDFIAPKSEISRVFRDSVLALAETEPFARRLVNSGRLSTATCYGHSPLNGPDGFTRRRMPRRFARAPRPSMPRWARRLAARPPRRRLHRCLVQSRRGGPARAGAGVRRTAGQPLPINQLAVVSRETACARYGAARDPHFYLFRPDQHVAARWRTFSAAATDHALARAIASTAR